MLPPRARRVSVPVLVALAAAMALVALPAITGVGVSAETNGQTVVSLTFDDGVRNHYTEATPILDEHGARGTFYVNSGRIGATNFLTQEDLEEMDATGHEIGGHTVDHADLPTLSPDDQRRSICNDRADLIARGFPVTSLAYPFGDATATTEQIAQECGYHSARGVGGLRTATACHGCPWSESVPPAKKFLTRATASVKNTTTLDDLKAYVTNAESNGGGWVQFVIHHVCEADCGGVYTMKPDLLDDFMTWLAPRADDNTVVKTVHEVMGGEVKPAVPGPPLPMAPGNLVLNPSLESFGAGYVPSCFQLGGFGTNTFSWSRTTDAHSGSFAEQLTINGYTSGDRKLVIAQNSATCAPKATPGTAYRLGVWYKGSWGPATSVRLVAYYRAGGVWKYWRTGPVLPTGAGWTKMPDYVTPAAPAGADAVSFGLAMTGNGTLITDDYAVSEAP
ncbi:polysaccharide deacetylase family protein [Pilimelia columellifera]|uniref:NodB homology domain-containing protein n=1 Tax=Pilimelia columellifera subsp. columellifera TaxID=706583 RepID=A0ABN3NKI8_9ACTN